MVVRFATKWICVFLVNKKMFIVSILLSAWINSPQTYTPSSALKPQLHSSQCSKSLSDRAQHACNMKTIIFCVVLISWNHLLGYGSIWKFSNLFAITKIIRLFIVELTLLFDRKKCREWGRRDGNCGPKIGVGILSDSSLRPFSQPFLFFSVDNL